MKMFPRSFPSHGKALLAAGVFVLFGGPSLFAHELFLQPRTYQIGEDDAIEADIKVGEEFSGLRYIYNQKEFRRLDVAVGDEVTPVTGRLGDMPAIQIPTRADGLHVLVYASNDKTLIYKEFAKFERFVEHKDLRDAIVRHRARGLPETRFVEAYSRYAKTLVAVGEAKGQDRAFGLETELVALANPYTDDLSAGLPVRVLYRGAPRGNAQVELFERRDNTVKITLHRTDAEGVAILPVTRGAEYMADAVLLREPSTELAAETNAVWETLWANLTFAVPE